MSDASEVVSAAACAAEGSGELERLIARCESAVGPDRELDTDIAVAVSGDPKAFASRPTANSIFKHVPGWWTDGGGKSHSTAHYTSGVDAALTLLPAGWQWDVSNRAPAPHTGRAYIHNRQLINGGISGLTRNPKYEGFEVTAATPAIAVCIVCLQARLAAQKRPTALPKDKALSSNGENDGP